MAKLGEWERQVRLGQDRLAIKRKRAESIYIVLPAPIPQNDPGGGGYLYFMW